MIDIYIIVFKFGLEINLCFSKLVNVKVNLKE